MKQQPGTLKIYIPSWHPGKRPVRSRIIFQERVENREAAAALSREWAVANPDLYRCGSFAVFCADPAYV